MGRKKIFILTNKNIVTSIKILFCFLMCRFIINVVIDGWSLWFIRFIQST